MFNTEIPLQCLYTVSQLVSHEIAHCVSQADLHSKLGQRFASGVVSKNMQVTRGKYATEYRVQLLVFTPEEFKQIVALEAQRICEAHNHASSVI